MAWLSVHEICKFGSHLKVLDNLSFEMNEGERLGIMGETGSGKSSLLKIIGGLMQPDSGGVYFKGERVAGPHERLLPGHPYIAYLSQFSELRPNFFVWEVLENVSQLNAREAKRLYDLCEVSHLLQRKTTQLSGGEKQRIALARLLTTHPDLLLLDEPFSHLDQMHKQSIKNVLENAAREFGFSTILVSHEPTDILSWADRMLVLRNGKIITMGRPCEIYRHPPDVYTAFLLGNCNLVQGDVANLLCGEAVFGNEEKLAIRPDSINISKTNSKGITAFIRSIHFYGPYFELKISGHGMDWNVVSMEKNWHAGDQIILSCLPSGITRLQE